MRVNAVPADFRAPEIYAGDALVQLYSGRQPSPPLTCDQERALIKSGFVDVFRGELVLTKKGEDLVLDTLDERDWILARGGVA